MAVVIYVLVLAGLAGMLGGCWAAWAVWLAARHGDMKRTCGRGAVNEISQTRGYVMNVRIKSRDAAAKILRVMQSNCGHDQDMQAFRRELESIVNKPANTDTFLPVEDLEAIISVCQFTIAIPISGPTYMHDAVARVKSSALPRLEALRDRRIESGAERQGRGRR